MGKIQNAVREIQYLDKIASRDQWINRIHPLVKLALTVLYITAVVSFHKYDIPGVARMAVYPVCIFILSETPFRESVKKLRIVLPFVICLGVLNPVFDREAVTVYGVTVRGGVLSMLTLILKGIFSVLAAYLLVATTKIEKLCYALRLLHVPKIMVTQLLLTYRYLSLLMTEVGRVTQAYALRAPRQKGIRFQAWGSLTGQILLRSMDRANDVYAGMLLRGYQGEFLYMRGQTKAAWTDFAYLAVWGALILLLRFMPGFETPRL